MSLNQEEGINKNEQERVYYKHIVAYVRGIQYNTINEYLINIYIYIDKMTGEYNIISGDTINGYEWDTIFNTI